MANEQCVTSNASQIYNHDMDRPCPQGYLVIPVQDFLDNNYNQLPSLVGDNVYWIRVYRQHPSITNYYIYQTQLPSNADDTNFTASTYYTHLLFSNDDYDALEIDYQNSQGGEQTTSLTIEQTFDSELYDLTHESIISSWVIGLGIGWVLAMLAKMKR